MNDSSTGKLLNAKHHVTAVVLTVVFFFFMLGVCKGHVMTYEEPWVTVFAILPAWVLSAVFWLAVVCFQVTLADQLKQKKQG